MKKINKEWTIELTEEQLMLISRALEFTSRFACGQIGFTYLPIEIQSLFKDDKGMTIWELGDKFDEYGNIIKTLLYPELKSNNRAHYGVGKLPYADDLYDIYKMINHMKQKYDQLNQSPDQRITNVNSHVVKFGKLPTIKLTKKIK